MDDIRVINLTGHPVRWQGKTIFPLSPEGTLRIKRQEQTLAPGLVEVRSAWPSFLPPLVPRTLYVVSRVTRERMQWRPDFVSPAAHVIRDGQVVGSRIMKGNPGMSWYTRRAWHHIATASTLEEARAMAAQDPHVLVLWMGWSRFVRADDEGIIAVPQPDWLGRLLLSPVQTPTHHHQGVAYVGA